MLLALLLPSLRSQTTLLLRRRCHDLCASPASLKGQENVKEKTEGVIEGVSKKLTHVDSAGLAAMVNISAKDETVRTATASGWVYLGPKAFELVAANQIAKGDVLTVAKIAGISGAKQTSALIPLCHHVALSAVEVELALDKQVDGVRVKAMASCRGATGVEMEALTAVSLTALTVYDMCKAVSKHIEIRDVRLESKFGGKSGDWTRQSKQ